MPTINRNMLGVVKRKKEETKSYKYYQRYYSLPEWRDLRNLYLQTHALCQCCLDHGRVVPAEHVHHIVPFDRGGDENKKLDLLLEEKNLMSLCKKCHKLIHIKDQREGMQFLNYLSDKEYRDGHGIDFMK